MTMKTPGVYVVEQNAFPNSVFAMPTSIPAFIGYTKNKIGGDRPTPNLPVRIKSFDEFVRAFGGPPDPVFAIDPENADPISAIGRLLVKTQAGAEHIALAQTSALYRLHDAMRLFFYNGGGDCYVVSVGEYTQPISAEALIGGLKTLETDVDPTLIVIPEAMSLPDQQAMAVQSAMIAHCDTMQDRFAILDVPLGHAPRDGHRGDPVARFTGQLPAKGLSCAAAYYPWLKTTIRTGRDFTYMNLALPDRLKLRQLLAKAVAGQDSDPIQEAINAIGEPRVSGTLNIPVTRAASVPLTSKTLMITDDVSTAEQIIVTVTSTQAQMHGYLSRQGAAGAITRFDYAELLAGRITFERTSDNAEDPAPKITLIARNAEGLESTPITLRIGAQIAPDVGEGRISMIDKVLRAVVPAYVDMMSTMAEITNISPAAPAMAGLYTMMDTTRGVWKAPAGISMNAVDRPCVAIDADAQEDLNMPGSGLSINPIRAFVGEGTLVSGARILGGNSPGTRHVNGKRTLIFLRSSLQPAVRAFVAEPNTAATWITVKAMVARFLTDVWKQGGFVGATPQEAFDVRIGLGETMTAQDVLDGRLVLSVLLALEHPGKFTELTISQALPTA